VTKKKRKDLCLFSIKAKGAVQLLYGKGGKRFPIEEKRGKTLA